MAKPKLLVIELWGLGDLVIATPFLQAASEKYAVTLLAKPFAQDLGARLWPQVRVVPFIAPWTAFHHKYRFSRWPWRELFRLRRLRKERFQLGLSARWDPRDHALLFGLGVRRRLGFARMGSGLFLSQNLQAPEFAMHAAGYWRKLAGALDLQLPVRPPETHALFHPQGDILLHTGAGHAVRVWPLDRYRELVMRLRQSRYRVQVACDPNQRDWWTASGEPAVVTPRTVTELIESFGRAGAFIGNDSGPGHLAACLGVPTFTLFGPQLPIRFAPLHPAAEWLDGKPCPYKPCQDACRFAAPNCLWDLPVEEVWLAVQAFIARRGAQVAMLDPEPPRIVPYRSPRPRRFIQLFCRYLRRGGEELSVARIARHLEAGGHEVARFWRASEEWTGTDRPATLVQARRAWRNHAVLSQLRELHERYEPDAWILHNIVPVISLGVYRLALELNVPVVRWVHNHRPISPSGTMYAGGRMLQPEDPLLALKEIWHGTWHGPLATAGLALGYKLLWLRGDFAAVKAWIVISREMRDVFLRAGFPPDELHCLPHSWDIHPPVDLDLDEGYFVFLGRMVPEKGVRFLMDLWQRPELRRLPLVMAGDGELTAKYRGRTPANIRWTGFVQGAEKRRLLAGARAMLFPSLAPEALGLVAYEAYEQGKPVLGTALGGVKEIIHDRETGRLLPPGDAEAWSAAILEHALSPELSRQRGRRGLNWLRENASPAAWNRKFDHVLEQTLPPRPN